MNNSNSKIRQNSNAWVDKTVEEYTICWIAFAKRKDILMNCFNLDSSLHYNGRGE